ncbi:LOW QUALITY PROTEIN: uncharacterized protein EMH_0036530 [Eimeria mitis]|uniref:Uncharacterized protein n=1 Tax=Eimeria mitis TaxID=44415 RepID=U6JR78_9EIME|nr:LOW QUALITY PROTEIN: uncharacterized protein EMH_0036530 [Eimeria mitis]CDJ27975.1 hypothetical protein EMH_0036530 [Eimeria mitis]
MQRSGECNLVLLLLLPRKPLLFLCSTRVNVSVVFTRSALQAEQVSGLYTSRCLLGHSGVIEFLEVALEARLAATVENASQQPSIRIWRLPPVESDSEDVRCTALVGSDRLNRQQLQVWELHGLLTTGRPNLLARQVSDFQELRLVSCGKENIRFWRIKNGHLPGCNVTLDGLGRGNLFTDIAFVLPDQATRSSSKGGLNSLAKLLASSTCGSLLEIDYFTRAVRRVFTLHQSAIWALSTGPGFCVTASADKTVKVWPLNFMAAYFSAVHVALRELYTVCEDGLVRVWTLPQLSQTFEMESPQDPPLCVAAHPTQRALALGFKSGAVRVLAVEGPAVWMEANHHNHPVTGIWFVHSPEVATDIAESCTRHITSQEPHQQPSIIGHRELLRAGNEVPGQGFLVISLDASGCICIFSQLHEFALIRKLENPQIEKPPEGVPALVFSNDGSKAVRYFSHRTLGFLRLPKFNFEAEFCPFSTACKSVAITTYSFSASGDALCVCGSDSRMRVFSLKNEAGTTSFRQSREIALLSGSISVAWISSAGSEESTIPPVGVTCGEDSLIKVWNLARLTAAPGNEASNQPEGSAWKEADGSAMVAEPNASQSLKAYQSFAGHNRPPFMVQLLGDYLVSVSATETITWRVGSPLLTAASDITPAGSIALLPPLQEGSPSADPLLLDFHSLQQQQQNQQQPTCEPVTLPQPQQPPRAHPQPLKQPLLNPLQAAQTTTGLTAISCSSNDASLTQHPSTSGPAESHPGHAAPPSSSSIATAAATIARAAETARSSGVADKTLDCAAAVHSSPLAAAAAQRINGGDLAVPAAPLSADGCEADSATVVVDTQSRLLRSRRMGVLAHAVGSWVLVERLSTPAASQDGKCLGLLPALLGRSAQQRVQQQQIQADSPKRKSPALQRQQRGTQLLQQCAAAAHAPRISVLRHPIVGAAIAFAIDTTARLAATISSMDFITFIICLS